MYDIQLRSHEKDLMLVLRSRKNEKDEPLVVDIVAILPSLDQVEVLQVTLAPNKSTEHLRDELRAELRAKLPRSYADLREIIQRIKQAQPRLFYT